VREILLAKKIEFNVFISDKDKRIKELENFISKIKQDVQKEEAR
jgi:hypothetical protein